MKQNTVILACNQQYFWGAFLLIASMRFNAMDEPVLIFQNDFSEEMRKTLLRFGDVRMIDAPPSPLNMTCRKPEAMLYADTDYLTWVDCDGFFVGNCSDLLTSPDPDKVHARLRSKKDNEEAFRSAGLYSPQDIPGTIPEQVLEGWKKDVRDLPDPKLKTCVSACFLGFHRSHRDFLRLWQEQMNRVLPHADVGVVNHHSFAYYQMDESVLNSLLCFSSIAPEVTDVFQMDKDPRRIYHHLVGRPKPWEMWTGSTRSSYPEIMRIIHWSIEQKFLGSPLPFALNPNFRMIHRMEPFFARGYHLAHGIYKRLRKK